MRQDQRLDHFPEKFLFFARLTYPRGQSSLIRLLILLQIFGKNNLASCSNQRRPSLLREPLRTHTHTHIHKAIDPHFCGFTLELGQTDRLESWLAYSRIRGSYFETISRNIGIAHGQDKSVYTGQAQIRLLRKCNNFQQRLIDRKEKRKEGINSGGGKNLEREIRFSNVGGSPYLSTTSPDAGRSPGQLYACKNRELIDESV